MVIIILGPQGSGKGTQAKLLSEKLNIPTVSSGEVLRDAFKKGTDAGIDAEKYWGKGYLVPNDILDNLMIDHLKSIDTSKGVIFDGYPRSREQLERLDYILERSGVPKVDVVLFIDISDKEAMKRLRRRASIERRKDDAEEAIKKRLKIYHKDTEPIVSEYRKKGMVIDIDGERSIEEIHKDILEKLGLSRMIPTG